MSVNNLEQSCPYCTKKIEAISKDHVFPQFLGGTRKVNCCKECNNSFGHTFEGKAAKILQTLHVYISSWGLPLKSASPIWKNAYTWEGKTYNFAVGGTGVVHNLAKPVIEYDEEGNIVKGLFPTKKQAQQAVESLLKKNKAQRVIIEENPSKDLDFSGLEHVLVLGPDLKRTALKMCMALSTMLPDFEINEISDARFYLRSDDNQNPDNVLPAYDLYNQIDSRRPALSHVIYVERGLDYISGFVQFFGVMQMYCHLGSANDSLERTALLAWLDPVTGEEKFTNTEILNLEEPPSEIRLREYPQLIQGWNNKFRSEAVLRNALTPPDLKFEFYVDGEIKILPG